MRHISKIILHCSDSDLISHDNVETITSWHLERGFKSIGYHYIITKTNPQGKFEATLYYGRPIQVAGAHCLGHNQDSIGIVLTGRENFTQGQFDLCAIVVAELCIEFGLHITDIYGHNQFSNKRCPVFDINEVTSIVASLLKVVK